MNRRRILIFTGSRAEYGLQYPILEAVAAHPRLDYQLFVAGSHFDDSFGKTLAEIEADGWHIDAREAFTLETDKIAATSVAIGQGVLLSSEVFTTLQPDICVIYGDRFEAFAAMIASTQMGIPTAHVEGGDITEGGTLDDSVRHAMSKLAHLHFVTNADAAQLLMTMGEEAGRVFNVGYPGNDVIYAKEYTTVDELCIRYRLEKQRPIILFTQHPLTIEADTAVAQLEPSLLALQHFAEQGMQIILTYANSDAGSRAMIDRLQSFADQYRHIQLHANLGRRDYHGLLAMIAQVTGGVCLGNSSSGFKETPAFCCPVINIGTRQDGRLSAGNVLFVDYDASAIIVAMQRAMTIEFKQHCQQCDNPYGQGGSGKKIADILADTVLDASLLRKKTTTMR